MRRVPPKPHVPAALTTAPFRADQAYDLGLSPRQLQSKCWHRLFADVFVATTLDLAPEHRFNALALALPAGAVVTGVTAAWAYGVWTPKPGHPLPLMAAVPAERTLTLGTVRTRRLVLDPADVEEFQTVGITSPLRTCFDLVRTLPAESRVAWPSGMRDVELVEGTSWVDMFLGAGLVTAPRLIDYALERPHWPGVRLVRLCAEFGSPRARSPMETRVRVILLLGGLSEPHINVGLWSPGGVFLGCPDLTYLEPLVGVEFDGTYHDDEWQLERDLVRENRLVVRGKVTMLRYGFHRIVRTPDAMLAEVAQAIGEPYVSMFDPEQPARSSKLRGIF